MDPDSETQKNNVVRFRASDTTTKYIEHLEDEWNCSSKSEALRILVHSFIGITHGNLYKVMDRDKLRNRWGGIGTVLAVAIEQDDAQLEHLSESRLGYVIDDVPSLLAAAREDAHVHPPDFPTSEDEHEAD